MSHPSKKTAAADGMAGDVVVPMIQAFVTSAVKDMLPAALAPTMRRVNELTGELRAKIKLFEAAVEKARATQEQLTEKAIALGILPQANAGGDKPN